MVSTLTMLPMVKKSAEGKSNPVSFRLTPDETELLDRAAAAQSIPVDRSTLVAYVVRKWLKDWDAGQSKAKDRGRP